MNAAGQEALCISADDLERTARIALRRSGMPERDAVLVARALVDADLRGVETHGCRMLPLYLEKIRLGLINPQATMSELRASGCATVLDGDNSLGHLAACVATERAIELASRYGVGVVTVRRTNHAGCLAYYPLMAAERGFVGFVTTVAAQNLAPWGGVEPLLGNNPFAIAFPTPGDFNLVLDMATSAVSKGRVRLAAQRGESIPEGWAVTAEGEPLTDPRAFVEAGAGAFLLTPIGGPKGSGMSIVNALLAGVLAGTDNLGLSIPSLTKTFDQVVDTGLYVQALNIEAFLEVNQYQQRMAEFVTRIKDSRPRQGVGEVMLPGEPEHRMKAERMKRGIPIARSLWSELQECSERPQV